jgi:hypothetical protein
MRFSLHMMDSVRRQIGDITSQMRDWEDTAQFDDDERKRIRDSIHFFQHCTVRPNLTVGGVDGSGDFPSLSYGDSFVYAAVAEGVAYESAPICGLREVEGLMEPLCALAWLPESQEKREEQLDRVFAQIAGCSVSTVVERSDYRLLKDKCSGLAHSVDGLVEDMIRPHAADAGNLGIQLRTAAELGAALRLLRSGQPLDYLLVDTTMSLPFVQRRRSSLFFEHMKRLCCVEAREQGTVFAALSKSHGLPCMEMIELLASDKLGLGEGERAEHWYMRLPTPKLDGWSFTATEGRNLPPPGAVTYLLRLHRKTPVFRVDFDRTHWQAEIGTGTPEDVAANEKRVFEDLDYASHDQRCYGYPYPLKSGHNRASLTKGERAALRKMIIDDAVAKGFRRSLFRNASMETGHA